MARDSTPRYGGEGTSRRRFLTGAGAAGASLTLLGGCVTSNDGGDGGSGSGGSDSGSSGSSGSGGSGDGGDGGDTGTTTSEQSISGDVTFGVLSPVSGAFAPLGAAQRKAAKLAVKQVNESDEYDVSINAVYEDNQTNPSTGRQKAQKLVQQDGAKFLTGCINSSVALAIMGYASGQGVMFTNGGAALEITGSSCNKYTFRNESNTAQQAAGLVDYMVENLGTNIWIHTADYAYGNSAIDQIKKGLDDASADTTIVGTTKPSLDTKDYGPYISKIKNSDAEVLAIPLTGGPLINFLKQADNAGLKDGVDIIGTAIFAQVVRGAVGSAAYGTYSSTLYDASLETGDNKQFVDAYTSAYDSPPGSFARVGYEGVRMTARGIQEAQSKDPDDVRKALAGLEMQTILGKRKFRECDHQAVNPVWTSQLVEPDSGDVADLKILDSVSGEEATPPCGAQGCDLSGA